MIDELRLLRGSDCIISDNLTMRLPTIGEICDYGEKKYYTMVSTMCSTPSDYKSILLDNFNTDYEEIGDFEFFTMLWSVLRADDISILLPGINFAEFEPKYTEKGILVLHNQSTGQIINEIDYLLLTDWLRALHGFEKHVDKAGNEATKRYLINKARKELQRQNKKDSEKSILLPLVSSLVNCEQFKYNHTTVWDLNIYQFMDSVKRIQKLKNYNQIMQGVYAGTVDSSKLNADRINWLGTLQ